MGIKLTGKKLLLMKIEKEMFIKDTDIVVEVDNIIVKDDVAYKVSYSNIPELVRKGIIEFKKAEYTPSYPVCLEWWFNNTIDEFTSYTDEEETLKDLFSAYPGALCSLILKSISETLNEERMNFEKTSYNINKNGYYFINAMNGKIVYVEPEKVKEDTDFNKFAFFISLKDAEYAAKVIEPMFM